MFHLGHYSGGRMGYKMLQSYIYCILSNWVSCNTAVTISKSCLAVAGSK